jgi:hypothetical protein
MEVPVNRIQIVPLYDGLDFSFLERAQVTREWFDPHMYKCLPLSIANQYGFIVRAPYAFEATWIPSEESVNHDRIEFKFDRPMNDQDPLIAESSFGRGILTLYPRFLVKTPPLINLWVKQPPNYFKAGVDWMEGVVETDNLSSTFTFNIKFHEPHKTIRFEQGEVLGSFIPIPRFFYDPFELEIVTDRKALNHYRKKDEEFLLARSRQIGIGFSEYFYRKGNDFAGCPFKHEHQITVNKPKKETSE